MLANTLRYTHSLSTECMACTAGVAGCKSTIGTDMFHAGRAEEKRVTVEGDLTRPADSSRPSLVVSCMVDIGR